LEIVANQFIIISKVRKNKFLILVLWFFMIIFFTIKML
jgi:hypothetical protein